MTHLPKTNEPELPTNIGPFVIPDDINNRSKLEAAKHYHEALRLAIHPLCGPEVGDAASKGKKPLFSRWRSHSTAEIDPEYIEQHFGATSSNNIGCVVRPPYVIIDLDSKQDHGISVVEWLQSQPDLATVPMERTGGGAHLIFRCLDLPETLHVLKEALVSNINDKVQAEFYTGALNVVLSPSIHKSGHQYKWEVTGPIPEVSFANLCKWFGFILPVKRGPGRPRKEPSWHSKYPEDLRTLDLVQALREHDVPIRKIGAKQSMWALQCPWSSEHSTEPPSDPGTATVVFVPPGKVPTFNCKHAHCADQSIKELINWMEDRRPGTIATHCSALRQWTPGRTDGGGRREIAMGGVGRPDSEFAAELGEAIGEKQTMFRRGEEVVELRRESIGEIDVTRFHVLTPKEFVTSIEAHVAIGYLKADDDGTEVFVLKSLDEKAARIILASSSFLGKLPLIDRILDTPIPLLGIGGEIVYPKARYDPEFRTWLAPNAPRICSMSLEEAIRVIDDLLAGAGRGGFWWKDRQSRTHALARLITPFLRGLMDWQKGPMWIIAGNAPGVGKDTLANLVHTVHTGRESSGAPLGKQNDDELRKRITSGLRAGVSYFHFANLKGHIDFPSLEAATDNTGVWEDRLLGQNHHLKLRNEAEYSLSSNNATWTPDLERRSRCIFLHCSLENPDRYQYRHADLLRVVRENRSKVLAALAALTRHWDELGRPPGPTGFTSFPRWGRVVGGVLTACGYPDPCLPQKHSEMSGDRETRSMQLFFRVAFDRFGNKPVPKKELVDFAKDDDLTQEYFDDIDFATRGGASKFGKLLQSYCDRSLGGLKLSYTTSSKNRGYFQFSRASDYRADEADEFVVGGRWGCVSTVGVGDENILSNSTTDGVFNRLYPIATENVPDVPKVPGTPSVVYCKSIETLQKMANDLLRAKFVVATLSPTSLDASKDPSLGLDEVHQLSLQGVPGNTIWVIDNRDNALQGAINMAINLSIRLSSKPVVTHEGILLQQWLGTRTSPLNVQCLTTAARLLQNGTDAPNDLDSCIARYCPITDAPGAHNLRRWELEVSDPLARTVNKRVHRLPELYAALKDEITSNGLERVWDLENRLLPVVSDLISTGIHVCVDKLGSLAESGNSEAQGLLNHVGNDDRIRSSFDPLGAVSGRFTSTSPALHQVSKGVVRGTFRPTSKDRLFVSADYAQHDIRVLAAVCADQALLDTFQRGADYHRLMAASLLGKPANAVTDQERKIAKAFSLGIVYGRSPDGFAETALKDFGIVIERPETILQTFLHDHPGYAAWVVECRKRANSGCDEVRTRIGRRRIIPPETDRGRRKRILMNTPIQGGAADAFKEAMILVHNRLTNGAKIVHCIHDELIVECSADQTKEVAEILERSMIEGMQMLYPEVAAKVETTVGEFWGDKLQP